MDRGAEAADQKVRRYASVHTLIAEGGTYARSEVHLKVSAGKAENVTIRLIPNRLYPVPPDMLRIDGKAPAGALIRIYSQDKAAAYKLLSDVKAGCTEIGIYHAPGVNIVGKLLKITAPDGKGEYLRIIAAGDEERSEYLTDGGLTADYPKLGTVIAPVSECAADAEGEFTLFFGGSSGNALICEMTEPGSEKPVLKEIPLTGSNYIKTEL